MKKILVVEDDKFIANAYRVKLTKAGFEIKMAYDGEEALEILKGFTPDLMLLDLIMPIKDGFTVLAEIRANPKWASIPVLVTSNLGQKEDIDRGMQLGANGYVIKTDLSMDELVTKINSLIKS
jgi:DNA-binding response OmpR family regulator